MSYIGFAMDVLLWRNVNLLVLLKASNNQKTKIQKVIYRTSRGPGNFL